MDQVIAQIMVEIVETLIVVEIEVVKSSFQAFQMAKAKVEDEIGCMD